MRAGLMVLITLLLAPALAAAAEPVPTFTYEPFADAPSMNPQIANGVEFNFGRLSEVSVRGMFIAPARMDHSAHPAVLWVHWLGEPATTNHTEFAADAQALAAHGVVSMLVDMPWSAPDWFSTGRAPAGDSADTIAEVIALRRALDVLATSPRVDPSRIAYVGHDFGAMDGALLLAVDSRPRYAVLITPTLSFWEWFLLGAQPDDSAAYVDRMSVFDLPPWLARGHQRATLLQFGRNDIYVSRATASAFRNALPDRDRSFKMYDADHALDIPAAHDDRRAWLLAHFGLTP